MPEPVAPSSPRGFSRVDATRVVLVLALLAVVGGCYWLLLPALQALVIPGAEGGANGPWVIRPIQAFHFGATAVLTAVSLPLLLAPLQRRWRRTDAASGTRWDPFRDRPSRRVRVLLQGSVLLLIYAAGLLFYLFSWTTIGPDGIRQRLPWGTRHSSFQEIAQLETIPHGMRSDALRTNGPWFNIKVRGGRDIHLSLDNEGMTSGELTAVTTFVASQSGLSWARRGDARPR